MTDDLNSKTVVQLRELLWSRKIAPSRWMLTYIKKAEAISFLEGTNILGDDYVTELRARQKNHMNKALEARKSRKEQFGIDKLTHKERVKVVIEQQGPLEYVEARQIEDGFVSATGSRRGKHAVVFKDKDGSEVLFTKGEAKLASCYGVNVPYSALVSPRTTKYGDLKTIKDVFE